MRKTPTEPFIDSSSVKIVLVRPRNPLNIGAAARAMSNFGFSDLVVVKPYAPVWQETVSAVGAEKLVLAARKTDSLSEAIADCHLVLGTTTTRRRSLRRSLIRLPDIFQTLDKRKFGKSHGRLKIAILFGSEKTGLANRHLEQCHYLLTIPTDERCPSMNLSQAVAVCCYELARVHRAIRRKSGIAARPTSGELDQLSRHVMGAFAAAGYLDFLPMQDRLTKIRRLLLGWNIHRSDLAILHGFLRFVLRKLGPPQKKLP